jgi:Flp pilus assembly protein TadB
VSTGGILGLVLALGFSAGALLVYDGLTRPAPGRAPRKPTRLLAVETRLRVFLRAAGLELPVRTFALYSLGCGVGCAIVAQQLLGWPVITLLAFGVGTLLLGLLYAPRAARRRAAERAALPELAEQLRAAVGAGDSIEQGMVKLAATGPTALRPELLRLALRQQVEGFEPALREFRDRLGEALVDEFCAALLLEYRVGGKQIGLVLSRQADSTRQKLALHQEAMARQAYVRLTARIVILTPVVTLVLLRLFTPDYLAVYDGPKGQLVLLGCLVWLAIGYAVLLRLGRLPSSPRVLVR